MAKSKKKLIAPVRYLMELKNLAASDENYKKLLLVSSENLGGSSKDSVEAAYQNLINNANETDEEGVVAEVNGCRDLI
jgi:flavin-binding protein dodecin